MKNLRGIIYLIMVLLVSVCLVGCGGEANEGGQIPESQSDKDIFLAGIANSITDLTDLTSTLASMQLDILINPESQFDPNQSSTTQIGVILNGDGDTIELNQSMLYNAENGEAARTVEAKMGEETASTAGVYFVGNDMLITRFDSEEPMVRHMLSDTSGMKTASVYERIDMVFSERNHKLTEEEWLAAATDYTNGISFVADTAYSHQTIDMQLAEISKTVTAYTMTVSGLDAYTVLLNFINLLAEDASFASYAQDAREKLTAMDQTAQEAMGLIFTVNILDNQAIGFNIEASCADGSKFILKTTNYQDGYARQTELRLNAFNGMSMATSAVFGQLTDQNQNCTINYQLSDPTSYAMNEEMTLSGSGIVDEGKSLNYSLNMNYNLNYTDEGENYQYQASGPVKYDSVINAASTDSTITIAGLSLNIDGESSVINVSINISQAETDVTITAPGFIAESGVTTSTALELINVLEADFTVDEYKSMPQSLRMVFSAVAL